MIETGTYQAALTRNAVEAELRVLSGFADHLSDLVDALIRALLRYRAATLVDPRCSQTLMDRCWANKLEVVASVVL
jgi:hypothetical protein